MAKKIQQMVYDVEDVTTIKELMARSVNLYGSRPAFLYDRGGEVGEISYLRAYREMVAFATYLRSILPEGCKVAVTGKNSYNWALTYLAVTCGVGVIVPIDKDLMADQLISLLKDSEAAAVVYSPEQEGKLEGLEGCIKLGMANMSEYIRRGNELLEAGDTSYKTHSINPHALGVLLYTSGTTGVAKGVMLSQYNICFDITHALRRVKVYPEDVALSVAPLHHTYETTVGLLVMMYSGVAVAYNSSLKKLQSELKLYRPTIMAAVPLILDTFRNVIIKKYGKMKGGRAVLALQRVASDVTGNKAGKKIFSIINETFGGRMRLLVCGAALLSPDVFKDYERFGIRLIIGYGLTETAPISAMHSDFYNAPDDIGYPVSGVQLKLDNVNEDGVGELLIKGPNVMLGYYKDHEATAAVMTEDGFFRTGDLARITPKGTYQIAGRAKSMIVSPGGKKIFPEELELYLERSEYIKECLVYEPDPEQMGYLAVAIVPDRESVDVYLDRQGISPDTESYLRAERSLFEAVVRENNLKFPAYKQIHQVYVRHRDFVKTTTKKIKRTDPDNLDNN